MDYGAFLAGVHSSGYLAVDPVFELENGSLVAQLQEFDATVRGDAPAGMPTLDVEAAAAGVRVLHSACVLLAHRELEIDEHQTRLVVQGVDLRAPSAHYSVDLALRHLPDVVGLARGRSPGDPLLGALHKVCRVWPLSSVGVELAESVDAPVDASVVVSHQGLRRFYVDRILRRRDRRRATDPSVRGAIQAAIGEHVRWAAFAADTEPHTGDGPATCK